MTLRSPKERLFQTLCFEAGGLLLSIPSYLAYSDHGAAEGTLVILAMTAAVLIISPLHNALFDTADLRLTGRVASDRPKVWRMVHAVSHELSTMILTLPILVALGGHGWGEALMLDLGFTALYMLYAYVFYLIYDHLRPIRPVAAALT
jgi:uncharacterized membrane protein